MLRTDTLSEQTLVLLKQLQQIPLLNGLRLVGGTALALQLGHRHSVDLDLFGTIVYDKIQLLDVLREQFEVNVIDDAKQIHIFSIDGVKVDMVDYPYDWIDTLIEDEGVRMASKKDIAAMKLEAIINRGTKKDFVDLYFLLQHFTLPEMLEFYSQKYTIDSSFMLIRSLNYFADAEEYPMPAMLIPTEWEDVKEKIRQEIRKL
jgi:predicted nucleotidyltransferase component of viral defense system